MTNAAAASRRTLKRASSRSMLRNSVRGTSGPFYSGLF
jgi:hypothetical protein